MKIVITNTTYPPTVSGAALVAQRLAENLAERGHEIYVFAPSDTGKFYEARERGVTVYRTPSITNPFRSDHRFSPWPFKKILEVAKEIKPDLLHTHDPLNIGYATVKVGEKLGIPTVLTVHAVPKFLSFYVPKIGGFDRAVEGLGWRLGAKTVNKCRVVVTPSQWVADLLKGRNSKTEVRVISNGVDTALFEPPESSREKEILRKNLGWPVSQKIIVFVGRLSQEKSIGVLVKSMPLVLENIEALLVLIGSGQEEVKLKTLANSLGVSEKVIFLGEVSYALLPNLYKAADVFAHPSAYECQSCVTLEAASCGLPIVGVRSGGIGEIVGSGSNGILVKPGDFQSFADALVKLLKDKRLAEKMSKASRQFAERHNFRNTCDDYEKLYFSLA
jgi:glycosyltransferase involved in cell wall biosynthesis